MKRKFLLLLTTMVLATIAVAPLATAFPTVNIYGYTDKTQYKPGETVTLKFWVYNHGPEDIILKNVTIEYPWYSPLWGGNNTQQPSTAALAKDKTSNHTETFTVPTDGRAWSGYITVHAVYGYGSGIYTETETFYLNVASAPAYGSLQDMDRLVTWFTIFVVLVIVCTIIVAATIFLAARRPTVSWKAEEEKS